MSVLQTTSTAVTLQFRSDSSVGGAGFQLTLCPLGKVGGPLGVCSSPQAPGEACSMSYQCTSLQCLGNVCCAAGTAAASGCEACASGTGACNQCDLGAGKVAGPLGTCLSRGGELCHSNSTCESGACRGGRCCAVGVSDACVSCDFFNSAIQNSDGLCSACSGGMFPDGINCLPSLPTGALCELQPPAFGILRAPVRQLCGTTNCK